MIVSYVLTAFMVASTVTTGFVVRLTSDVRLSDSQSYQDCNVLDPTLVNKTGAPHHLSEISLKTIEELDLTLMSHSSTMSYIIVWVKSVICFKGLTKLEVANDVAFQTDLEVITNIYFQTDLEVIKDQDRNCKLFKRYLRVEFSIIKKYPTVYVLVNDSKVGVQCFPPSVGSVATPILEFIIHRADSGVRVKTSCMGYVHGAINFSKVGLSENHGSYTNYFLPNSNDDRLITICLSMRNWYSYWLELNLSQLTTAKRYIESTSQLLNYCDNKVNFIEKVPDFINSVFIHKF